MNVISGASSGNRPNPPMRRTSSVTSSTSDMTSPTHMVSVSPPPPPAPQPHIAANSQHSTSDTDSRAAANGFGNDGSNSTTPRGSMENLPPPPPDLLNSDDDEIPRPPSQQKVDIDHFLWNRANQK